MCRDNSFIKARLAAYERLACAPEIEHFDKPDKDGNVAEIVYTAKMNLVVRERRSVSRLIFDDD